MTYWSKIDRPVNIIKDVISILKRSAVAILIAIGILAAASPAASSKPGGRAESVSQVRGVVTPFEDDISNYTPKQAAEYWNDWGTEYSRTGPMTNMFVCFLNAVRLMPHESIYHRNLATSLFMYRKDAKEFFGVDEAQVFSMSLREYRKARILDPNNIELAKELALAHYAIRPFRTEEALTEWERVLAMADKGSSVDKEEIYLNLGRVNYMAARYSEAQKWLSKVKSPAHEEIRNILWLRVTESAQLRTGEVTN
jgi:tetratricopeptide (TPR) repeat protein